MIRVLAQSLARMLREGRTLFLMAVFGVALGVASVVAIQTLNQGALQAFDGGMRAVSGQADLTITGTVPALPETLLVRVLADEDVTAAWGLCRVDVAVRDDPGLLLDVLGVDLLAPLQLPIQTDDVAGYGGDLEAALTTPGWMAVTPRLAVAQGWAVGDSVAVSSGSRTAHLIVGAMVDFQAIEPMAPLTLAVMDIAQVQFLLARPGLLHQIDLQLREGTDPKVAAARLERNLGSGVRAVTPEQRSQDTRSLLEAFSLNLTALSLISVFVGVFLVLASVQASLSRRRREFGILRCIGATCGQILGLIGAETTILALLGVLLGIPLGFWLAQRNLETVSATLTSIYIIEGIDHLILRPGVVLLGLAVGMIGAIGGAVWPAVDMARRDPLTLLAAVTVHEKSADAAGFLTRLALVLAVLATGWFTLWGRGLDWGGFLFGGVMMLTLPMVVPLVVRSASGWARPGSIGPALGLRNLRVRLQSTSLAVAALAITVSMLVGITLLTGSFRATLVRWLDITVRADIYVSTESWVRSGTEAVLDAALLDDLRRQPGVAAVEEQRRIRVATADGLRQIWLNGIKVAGLPGTELATRLPLMRGRPEEVAAGLDRGEVLIGEPLSRKAQLDIGDTLYLASPQGPKGFRVAGIAYDYTSEGGTAFLTMPYLQDVYPGEPTNNAALFLAEGQEAGAVLAGLKKRYRDRPLVLRSNEDLRREVLAIFDQTFAVTRTLQWLALAIAAMGVALNLLVQSRERAGELALLRALGATRRQVFTLFVSEGAGIGLLGLFLGLIGGLGLAALLILSVNRQWFGWTIQPSWPGRDLALQMVAVMAATLAAATAPALRARLTGPEALTRDDL